MTITMATKTSTSRRVALIVGMLFLGAILAYGIGTSLTTAVLSAPEYLSNVSANATEFTLGAALMLVNSVIVAAIGVLLFPVLKQHSRTIALIYLSGRMIESVVLIVGVVSLLSLVSISDHFVTAGATDAADLAAQGILALDVNDTAYQVAMAALGFASLFFCGLLFRSRLIPRFLAVWGFAGYAIFLIGAVFELLGFTGWGLPLSIPGGLFELTIGVWLLVRGFNPPTIISTTAKEDAITV